MKTDYDYREQLRLQMWKALNIVFPKMVFRSVIRVLGDEPTRVLFRLLKDKEFSYLPFVVSAEIPEDLDETYKKLFQHPQFMVAVNLLRISRLETYMSDRLSLQMQDFLMVLLNYLQETERCYRMPLYDKYSTCSFGSFHEIKQAFQQEEQTFMDGLWELNLHEQYVVCCIATLCLEEFDHDSIMNLEMLFNAWKPQFIEMAKN